MKHLLTVTTALFFSLAIQAGTRAINGKLRACTSFPAMNVEVTSKKISGETDTLKINLAFIDTKMIREIAVNSGFLTETNLKYVVINLQEEKNDYCIYSEIISLLRARVSGISISNGGAITT